MKRLLSFFVALLATTCLWAQNNVITYTATEQLTEVSAYSFGNGLSISSHTFSDGLGTITFWGGEVIRIGTSAFINCSALTSITIPSSVTSIDTWAFEGCTNLASITIPNSVTSIDNGAFIGCSGLVSITLPNSVKTIGGYAFEDCSSLISITIPESVTSIGYYAFNGCSSLSSISILSVATSIGDNAFNDCIGLTSITIPDGVTSIGNDAFSGCSNLTSVTWNATNCSVPSVHYYAPFSSISTKITSFVLGNNVTTIPENLCRGMRNLSTITIPNSVTSIGNYAFYDCIGLTSVTIPNSITNIDNLAFVGCSHLQTIYAHPTALPTLGSYVFSSVPTTAVLYVPTESKSLYQGASQWSDFTTIRELHDVTVGSAEWASLCLPYDAEIPSEVTVYQGVVGNRYVSLSEIEQSNMLPANTGCVINAPAGTYTFLQTTETPTAVQNNDIHGVTVETEYSNLYNAQTETLLTLGLDNDDNVGFHQPNTTYSPQMEAYKAYILYPGVAQAPLRILMPGENPIATGVEQTLFDSPLKGECVKAMLNGQLVIARGGHYYDLNGKIVK